MARSAFLPGIVLVVTAAVALAWANSPWAGAYTALFGSWAGFVVNDVLMTLFFFSVGLEIRHEMADGVFRTVRGAALPLVAAVGGMAVPALIYVAVNARGGALSGWGVPMATDIAFAVGVLSLLGARVPPALRILLLALAVIDDIGAIVVIALFYSTGIALVGLAIVAAALAVVLILRRVGASSFWFYLPVGAAMWFGAHEAGIHPSLAGVALALVMPWNDLQRVLKPWVDFAVMPLFALGNAGVALGGVALAGEPLRAFLGVGLGLFVGKPVGVVFACLATTRLGWTRIPADLGLRHLVVLGLAAGIGFTMALFVAELAFIDSRNLGTAKLGILAASLISALVCLGAGVVFLGRPVDPLAARSSSG